MGTTTTQMPSKCGAEAGALRQAAVDEDLLAPGEAPLHAPPDVDPLPLASSRERDGAEAAHMAVRIWW